ncbi:MAG: SH3 domain-containing protein [Bdellovibrionales bacterium]
MLKIAAYLFIIITFISFAAHANSPLSGSGLPLPRFVSLRTNQVNLRTGPGTRYPIEWVFRQQGLPLEVTAEYDVWRRVRDWEGTEGWVHKSTLSGQRYAIVKGEKNKKLRASKTLDAPVKALLDPKTIGHITACETNWCEVTFENVTGYLPKSAFWGAYRNEVFN